MRASKVCSKCHNEKPLSEFRNDKYTKSGKTTRCKMCLKRNPGMPKEVRCFYCREWFTKTQSSYKFCKPICHSRYWSKVWRLSPEGRIYMMDYHRNYVRTDKYTDILQYG